MHGLRLQPAASPKPSEYKYPDLPPQTHSLNKGYAWKADGAGKQTLGMDGHHANTAGEYLGGCVWFEVRFGQSVVGNTFVPKGLTPADVQLLQRIAHETVERSRASAESQDKR